MKGLPLRISLVAITLCNQLSFGMEESSKLALTAPCFSDLSLEMQDRVMKYSDNFSNIQLTSKHWSERKSIKCRHVFITDVCTVAHERMLRILLNAVYKNNYEGVRNILEHSNVLRDHPPYYHIDTLLDDTKVVLDLHTIATYNDDEEMNKLLKSHNVPLLSSEEYMLCPSDLMIASLAGNSQDIKDYLSDINENIKAVARANKKKHAFKIAINCDHGKCIKEFIDDLYSDSNIYDVMYHSKEREFLLKRGFLEHACKAKKLNALKELLALKYFDVNEIKNGQTLLDAILQKAEEDAEYNAVALLLQQYGAKTAQKVIEYQEDGEFSTRSWGGCIIS